MIPLLVIIALGVLAILAVTLRLAIDLRAIRAHLLPDIHAALLRQAWSYAPLGHYPHMPPHDISRKAAFHFPHMHMVKSGYNAAWEWRDGRWRMVSQDLPPGVDPGPPPAKPGAYDGEIVTTRLPGQE
jgi:hypothetical protein